LAGSASARRRAAAISATTAIDLTTAEFDLLWLLARHAGNILSRDDLLQELRGIGFDGLDRSIDARISRLRRKLGDDPGEPDTHQDRARQGLPVQQA
jgi:two-component system OmpR family response regulator